jgi:hypothetical protein
MIDNLTITVSATRSYLFAWKQCLRAIVAAASFCKDVNFIFATDDSIEGRKAVEFAEKEIPDGWRIIALKLPIKDDTSTRYKEEAQLRIAALQGAAFSEARRIRSNACWVVESDVVVPPDSLQVLEWVLKMPTANGSPFYDVAAATYSNGLFLGGFGSPQHHIAEDFLPSEKKMPARLKLCFEKCGERLSQKATNETEWKSLQPMFEKEGKRMGRLRERIKNCPPDGNVWEVTAKHGWRRRGWMDFAYPSIGRGAIVPSDWCGLGCTLLSARALAHADFTGYEGKGTQDLFLCWSRWYPASLKIACVPHIVCDHIKRKPTDAPTDAPEIIHYRAYHETEGEHRGHLRVKSQGFVSV